MNSLIKIAVVLTFAAVASGNLPAVINQVRKGTVSASRIQGIEVAKSYAHAYRLK
ncbi:hypothetical protein [Bdellovibrio bacteriovorus]|uniref:hypothetical protein n=1 Tax=Bdellovibrio bacteriovorus TaxID=959 RepID=UPI000B0D60DD|nr:hypothetical protein [Bdellovibrio bacteriovorus]